MEPLKSGFGVARAVMPLLYCGGLYYYFSSGTFGPEGPASTSGMSPNMLVIICAGGLIFSIPLILKLVRIFARARSAGSAAAVGDDTGGFDPDAAIARYMANRPVEAASSAPAARPVYAAGAPAKPSGFGRRGR